MSNEHPIAAQAINELLFFMGRGYSLVSEGHTPGFTKAADVGRAGIIRGWSRDERVKEWCDE